MVMEIDVVGGIEPEPLAIDDYQAPIARPRVQVPLRQLRGEAFYAAATMPPAELESTYLDIMDGLSRQGEHPKVEQLKNQGVQEKQKAAIKRLTNIATNPELTPEAKVPVAKEIIKEAHRPVTMEESYLGQVAEQTRKPLEIDTSEDPLEEQVLEETSVEFERSIRQEKKDSLLAWTQAWGGMGSAIGMSIPAGLFGLFHAIRTQDSAAAAEVVAAISQAGYLPEGEAAQAAMKIIAEKAAYLDIIPKWFGDKTFDYWPENLPGRAEGATAVYLIADPLWWVPLGVRVAGKAAVKAYVREMHPNYKYTTREEPTFEKRDSTVWFDTNNPVGKVSQIDRPKAAEMATAAVKSPNLAEAAGTSARDLLNAYLLPKHETVMSQVRRVFPDISASLAKMDKKFVDLYDVSKVSPFLFDVAAIGKNLDKHFEIMDQVKSIYPIMSSSSFENVGRAFRGKILFGQKPNKGFASGEEAIDAMVDLKKMAKDKYRDSDVKPKFSVREMEDPQGGKEFFIEWDFHRMFDPNIDTSLGTSAIFGPFDVTNFANTKLGQWIYSPASRLATWTTAGPARATINQTKLERAWADTLKEDILSVSPRQELAQAIYEGETRGVDMLSIKELQDLNPRMPSKDFKQLVKGYYHYRRLADHMYTVMNDIYRTQKVTGGFYGLFDLDGTHIGNLGKKVEFEPTVLNKETGELVPGLRAPLIAKGGDVAASVYNFTKVAKEDAATGKMVQQALGEQPVASLKSDTVVYKLDKPYTLDGQVFEFAVGLKDGAIPFNLLPKIPGYYPHINLEHYFIKAVPKQLRLNGRDVDNIPANRDVYFQNATTVRVARKEKDAHKEAALLAKENKDFTYEVSVEKLEVDDSLRTTLEMVKYAQDISKSRKADRLALPDGSLGRLEDPAVSMEKRLNQAARLLAWKDQDFLFRERFTQTYESLFKDGKFPESVADLQIPGGGLVNRRADTALLKDAILNFEQYARQQKSKATFFEGFWTSKVADVGRLMEEANPAWLEKWITDYPGKIKDLARIRDPIINNLIKLTTFKHIHLHPFRQIWVQPAQLWELHGLALMGGNTLYTRDMVNIFPKIFADVLIRSTNLAPDSVKMMFRESAHANTPYSKAEMNDILDAFQKSGMENAIDKQANIEGVFTSASQAIDVAPGQHLFDQAKAVTKGMIHLPQRIGFNKGELMNLIGLWTYARSDFIKNNPGKKWNDPHNLEQIASKAWGVGNGMHTRADLLPFQEGTLRLFMQFYGYSSKAAFQPLNSKFLSQSEKTRLAAVRLMGFGMDGIAFGPMVLNQVRKHYHEQTAHLPPSELEDQGLVEEMFALAERGLVDPVVNFFLRLFDDPNFGTKTDLLISKDLAPVGGAKVGLPLADLIFEMWDVYNGMGEFSDKFAFLKATSSLFKTYDDVTMLLKATEVEEMDIPALIGYINKTTEFAGGASAFERSLAMAHHRSIVDKMGNPQNLQVTMIEAHAKKLSIMSAKEQGHYEIINQGVRLKKEIDDTAKKIVGYLDTAEDVYDPRKKEYANLSVEEKFAFHAERRERVKWLVTIYDEAKLGAELTDAIRTQMNRQEKAGIETAINRMQQRNDIDYIDPYRRRMFEVMKQLKATGHKDIVDKIDRIFIDTDTILEDKGKPAMEIEVTGEGQ